MTTFMNPFKKAHALIERHPVKRLAWATLYDRDTDCRCATGVMAFESGVDSGFGGRGSLTCRVNDQRSYVAHEVTAWATSQGFTPDDLSIIEHVNDFYSDVELEEEARYAMVLRVLRALGEYDETRVEELRTAYAKKTQDTPGQGKLIKALIKEIDT